jgi:hypothetical protein
MIKGINTFRALMVAAFLFAASSVFPFTDQTSTERILKENKRFVEFVNVSISNFADDRKEDLKKAYEKHFNADIAYLQSDYHRAYKRVYSSQEEMEKLYRELVKNYYLEDSKQILDRLAPGIIRSKNPRARLYLTLGYRDRTVSWVHYTVGDSSNPKLYSYKLYKYVDAIKMARRAKRYAFLALFESQTREMKRKIYNQLCKTERDMNNRFMVRFIDLNDQDYIKEMDKNHDDFVRDEAARRKGQESGDSGKYSADSAGGQSYESKVENRVRFRNETKAARYLLNGDFDMAEDIMRDYIDDFNFKLILATFDVLGAGGEQAEPDKHRLGKADYDKFKLHLADNYNRFSKKSALDGFLDTVKVEDDIPEKNAEHEGEGVKPGDTKRLNDGAATPEKKADTTDKAEKKEEKKIQ